MAVVEIAKIQVRRGQENQTGIPRLDPGEFGWAEDTQNLYIGKRVSEGANSDDNARILTDKDLTNIFSLAQAGVQTISSATAYQYRADQAILGVIHSNTQTIATKLDTWVSITDVVTGTWYYSSGTDITLMLQNTIGTISNQYGVMFNHHPERIPASTIKIPAGHYTINGTIDIPPNTKIVGDGAGLTVLTAAASVPIFQTVDIGGNHFAQMSGGNLAALPRNIHLEGLTLVGNGASSIVKLDNAADSSIKNVHFNAGVVGGTSQAIAVEIHSYSVDDATLAVSSNILIDDCKFTGLDRAVFQSAGTTNRFFIQNSKFDWMNRGIEMWSNSVGIGPVNGSIDNNTFEFIAKEAIYIGTSTNVSDNGLVVSSNNTFRDVGNNLNNDTSQVTSIIKFNNQGNRSIDDYFDRLYQEMSTGFNYPPVTGPATIQSPTTQLVTIGSDIASGYPVLNIALDGTREQMVTVNYTMIDSTNQVFSRTGQLTLNITPQNLDLNIDTFASVSDYFNYAEVVTNASNFVVFSTDYTSYIPNNYVTLTCWNQLAYSTSTTGLSQSVSTDFKIEYQYNILQ